MAMKKMMPTHVVVIPDGNRRWAKEWGKSAYFGHSRGAAAFEKIAVYSFDQGVKCLSIWGMSRDNLEKRSRMEVLALMKIFKDNFVEFLRCRKVNSL